VLGCGIAMKGCFSIMQEYMHISVRNTVTGQFCKYNQKHHGRSDLNERQQTSVRAFVKANSEILPMQDLEA
jgi:uncharacterized radical SAM superfamily protein